MVGIRACLVVFVASQARKNGKIGCVRMALRTRGPFSTVIAAVNWEVLAVVVERR